MDRMKNDDASTRRCDRDARTVNVLRSAPGD